MFRRVPRLCELCIQASGVHIRANVGTPVCWSPEVAACHSAVSRRLQMTQQRSFVISQVWENGNKDNSMDLSKDPLIKEWLKEVQEDFGRGGKEKESEFSEGGETVRMQETREVQSDTESSDATLGPPEQTPTKSSLQAWTQFATKKYEAFDPRSPQIIYDYNEERLRQEEKLEEEEEEEEQMREKVKLERGERGVFDIEELVEVLREENGQDITVIQVPASLMYVEYVVIVSSRSKRHSDALAQIVRRAYNAKKSYKDPALILEGRGTDWVAMDLRNIALHIMDVRTRETYDLETLWSVGAEYDDKSQQPDEDDVLSVYKNLDPLVGLRAPAVSPSQK